MSTIPTVYFIDDSATMREVIKIAFRRENINVVACHDAATALTEIETAKPDIVITDVIMPDKDGYDVCQHIKSHPELAKTPVILMSGVVNRAVAERAFAVKADELLRKPFQPQDLIARVKHLLKSNGAPVPTPAAAANAAVALSSIFSAAATAPMPPRSVPATPAPVQQRAAVAASVAPAAAMPLPITATAAVPLPQPVAVATPPMAGSSSSTQPAVTNGNGTASAAKAAPLNDAGKLKIEIMRLEGLVKKLQSELQAEREY
ncbi:MAG TPA: response regulator, partial [Candidatus Limnocylindrales bacterium]|nr:response regulator [Candidatus Limnocylindrales bacterium]